MTHARLSMEPTAMYIKQLEGYFDQRQKLHVGRNDCYAKVDGLAYHIKEDDDIICVPGSKAARCSRHRGAKDDPRVATKKKHLSNKSDLDDAKVKPFLAMVDQTPLSSADPSTSGQVEDISLNRTRSREMVDVVHHHIVDEDPLLISQTLTYVTDDGSVVHSFHSAPFSFGFKAQFILLEVVFVTLLIFAVPVGAHTTVVAVSIANLLAVAWFWYNYVRSVEVTSDGNLRFWIGNIEVDVPYDKIVSIRRIAGTTFPASCFPSIMPYRGFLSNPMDGVSIVTTVPSTPFWLWPRSAGKPDRSFFFGLIMCPKLTIIFSPSGGGHSFVTDVENEMRSFANGTSRRSRGANGITTPRTNPDFLDV